MNRQASRFQHIDLNTKSYLYQTKAILRQRQEEMVSDINIRNISLAQINVDQENIRFDG